MKQVRIAIARFYNAKFINLPDKEEIIWKVTYEGMEVVARLSKTTTYSTWGTISYDIGTETNSKTHTVPGPEKYPADLYTEIIVYRLVEVTKEDFILLEAGSIEVRDKLLRKFEEFEPVMTQAINYCAGMLGVRVSPELVSIPIFELDHRYIFLNKQVYSASLGVLIQYSSSVNVLHDGDNVIQHSLTSLSLKKKDNIKKATESVGWLLKAWSTEDSSLKFISLFTALEFIIPPQPLMSKDEFDEIKNKIKSVISESEELKGINSDLFLLNYPPQNSLVDRFQYFASMSKLPQWEKDIEDFKKYYRIRNGILHQADSSLNSNISIENESVNQFEIFVNKYVQFILYGTRKPSAITSKSRTAIWSTVNFLLV